MSNNIKTIYALEDSTENNVKIVCKECANETSHSIIATYIEKGDEACGGGHSYQWTNRNEIIQCLGCESVSFRIVSDNSEDWDHDYDSDPQEPDVIYHKTYKYYPSRFAGMQEVDVHMLPDKIRGIYQETILAIENEQSILSGIGVRALIETICKDQNVSGKNLFEKLDSLHSNSIVTTEGLKALHKLRVLGNESAHEVKAHSKEVLILAFEVIKHMLEGTYILPQKVTKVFPENKSEKT